MPAQDPSRGHITAVRAASIKRVLRELSSEDINQIVAEHTDLAEVDGYLDRFYIVERD